MSTGHLMATNDYVPVEFLNPHEDAFYFAEHETVAGLDQDSFIKSSRCLLEYCIRNNDNKFLILNTDGEFQAENLSQEQQRQNDSKFNIQFYNDNLEAELGRPVILYTMKDESLWVVSCNEKGEIRPEKMDELPSEIQENKYKAVFYRREVASNRYLLQSSLCNLKYLGFESPKNGSPVLKLVLLPWEDEVDARHEVIMSPKK